MAIRESKGSFGRIEELAKAMTSVKLQLEKKLGQNRRRIEERQLAAKSLDGQLRTLQTDMEMAFGAKEFKVALLHKRVGGASYIKGRCWWHGKQREVQIGSIPSVMERFRHMVDQGEYAEIELPEKGELSWETLKGNEQLVRIVKDMGRARLREYIIRKLLAEHLGVDSDDEMPGPAPGEHDISLQRTRQPGADTDEWYIQWRKENLSGLDR